MSQQVKEEPQNQPPPDSPGFEDDVSLSPSPPPSGEAGEAAATTSNGELEDGEDSLDLDMSGADSKVWLVRMPRFLMERWARKDHNGEELGKVKIRTDKGKDWQVQLELADTEINRDIPQNYNINLTKRTVENTYIFTEKDMPKYKKSRTSQHQALSQEGQNIEKEAHEKHRQQRKGKFRFYNKNRDYVPFVKTIPKKTALVGTVCHECNVQPDIHDPNYSRIIDERRALLQSDAPTRERVTLLDDIPGVSAPTLGGSMSRAGPSFIRAQKRDPKNTDGKATRMPKNELLDTLFKLFEEYDYWSMRGLRERTRQPESYLKEVLETMAVLNKKGPYAMRYSLKPEFKQIKGTTNSLSDYMNNNNGTGTNGTQEEGENGGEEDEDDDNEEMETVDLT